MVNEASDDEDLVACADCGAEIAAGADPSFPFSTESTLCFECAIRRGGEYDASEDRWIVKPDLSDLAAGDEEA